MINLGMNFTRAEDLEIIAQLSARTHLNFVEILIDNFMYFDPIHIKDVLRDLPCAIHVMNSHWVTDQTFLESQLIITIKNWIKALKPIYISDHLLIGRRDGSFLPLNVELDYDQDPEHIVKKLGMYQDALSSRIYLENYPSYFKSASSNQIDFFTALLGGSNCGLLFDFSNAFIADANTQLGWQNWLPLTRRYPVNFHIFDYAEATKSLFDTQTRNVLFERFLNEYFDQNGGLSWRTPIYLFDFLSAHGYANDNVANELAINAVRYWAKLDKSKNRFLFLFLKNRRVFFAAHKAMSFTSKSCVKILQAPNPLTSRHAFLAFEHEQSPTSALCQQEEMQFI